MLQWADLCLQNKFDKMGAMLQSIASHLFIPIMRVTIFCILLYSPAQLWAQNLVPNGGFEEIWKCPTAGGQINGYLKNWFTTFSTPDLYHQCAGLWMPLWSEPRSGNGVVTISNLSSTNGGLHEYMHVKLRNSLVKDSLYHFSAWLRPCSDRFYHTDQFHVVFSDTLVSFVPLPGPQAGYLPLTPDIKWQSGIIPWGEEWILFEDCYRARGNEQYMIIGNFSPDALTTIDTGTLLGDVYRWDDIAIVPLSLPRGPALADRCEGDTMWLPVYSEDITITIDGTPVSEKYIPERAGSLDVRMVHRLCGIVDSLQVQISECPEPVICDVFLPTAFSPNNDGNNDEWQVHTPCSFSYFKVALFDRWGEQIFTTSHPDISWDGTFRGQLMPGGVYAGYIQYQWEGIGQGFSQTFHIHLLR
ncbi:MAG: gliding motility-associated C-terminal domain-containing protein [Saprospiraceae bacterium]